LCHRVIAPQLAYIKDSPADMRSAFPPRMRQALDLLLQGQGEKQIATVMGISRHTVHDLAKEIYRRVRVSSRAELMARFIDRDGATGRSAK
jgi:DNA-binding NarL/FixJ family response regulator